MSSRTARPNRANPSFTAAEIAGGLVLGAWVLLCDVLIKILVRVAACPGPEKLEVSWLPLPWSSPQGCTGSDLGGGLALVPAWREPGLLARLTESDLPFLTGGAWGGVLVGFAALVTVLVVRWRWRAAGDPLALGALWAGILIHALPRLLGSSGSFTEFEWLGLSTGLGDMALAWGLLWLIWRFLAELAA